MPHHCLITGGAGFIGSHLAEHLLSAGCRVSILDDLSTGRRENISHLSANPQFRFVQDTVENKAVVTEMMQKADVCYHLASAVGVQLIVDKPVETIRTIIGGTQVVLEAARQFSRPVLVTSSSEVYGKGSKVPFCEDDDVVMGSTRHSRWCYAYSKGIDEFLALAHHHQFGLPTVIVRLFNTVGPRQVGMYGMVLPRFASAALKNQPLKVYGNGKQTRCFCHVADVVRTLVELMSTPKAIGGVFNLGSDAEVSIEDLAHRVIQISGSKSTIEYVPYEQAYGRPIDDMPRRVPSLTNLRRIVAFQPKYNLDQIIESVVDHQRLVDPA
ncbi:MAG TPA: GDP-mannose 4,6-dehydratase [Tepidisphaeraceae bacterium]|nr:GDP-mannose 4,6-dehydratase [Tepidisphaeraceae bacterium]